MIIDVHFFYTHLIGQSPIPHRVSFSIKPDATLETRRNSQVTIFWQILDEECQDDQWHLKVGTRHQTLLSYPRENTSRPNEDYTDYNVSAVPGRCESNGQKINVTLTIFVSEQVDISEHVFCKIRILDPNSNETSRVSLVIYNDTTTTTSTLTSTYATTTRITDTTTDNMPADTTGTSSVAHTTVMHHVLLVSVLLALSLHFVH